MPFPRRLLNEGEEIVLDLRPHWWFLSGPIAALAIAVVVAIAALVVDVASVLKLATAVLLLAALAWFGTRYLRWTTTNFVLTSDRLIYRSGVLAKHGKEIPLERINDISFHQSIFERIIGAGDLMIESGGERGQQHFSDIRRPAHVQNEIYRQIERARAREADRQVRGHEPTVLEQLEKLDELRQRGIISQAEFDAKKTQLLERM
jgi:uncharacterized membrane protein YdbT with pleckstrin-like domain